MDIKNLIKHNHLIDLLYLFSGSLGNAWLSSTFPWWGRHLLFIDDYLIEGNSFLYIILYFSFGFVFAVFLREIGEITYKIISRALNKFDFNLSPYPAVITDEHGNLTEEQLYFKFRHIARINAHLIFIAFFLIIIFLGYYFSSSKYLLLIAFIFFIVSIRNTNILLKVQL